MCNLRSLTKGPQAIRDFPNAMRGDVGSMPPLPGVFPDYFAIVCNGASGANLLRSDWNANYPGRGIEDCCRHLASSISIVSIAKPSALCSNSNAKAQKRPGAIVKGEGHGFFEERGLHIIGGDLP
jgi:hypothetical protein